jgi:hypothetical protein
VRSRSSVSRDQIHEIHVILEKEKKERGKRWGKGERRGERGGREVVGQGEEWRGEKRRVRGGEEIRKNEERENQRIQFSVVLCRVA